MANEKKLIGWVLQKSDELILSIDEMTWIKDFFPHLTDVGAKIEFEGKSYFGWGWGIDEEEALAKAIAESIERIVFTQSGLSTTNGLAAHTSAERASRAAVSELKERDLFLVHFFSGIPFQKITDASVLSSTFGFREWLRARDVDLHFYQLGQNGVGCLVDGRRAGFGFNVGGAVKDTIGNSVISACVEAGRRTHRLLVGRDQLKPISLDEFALLEKPSFGDHGRLALNLDYAQKIERLFFSDGRVLEKPLNDVKTEPLFLNLKSGTENCPLHFAHATSKNVQQLFTGMPSVDRINLNRLREVTGKELAWDQVNFLPHPVD